MKNYKIFLIIISNIVIFLILFVSLDKYLEKNYYKFLGLMKFPEKQNSNIEVNNIQTEDVPDNMRIPFTEENFKEWCDAPRRNFGDNFTKKPIVVLGCSYAYGHGLTKEESFPNVLSLTTQRPVISFAECASNVLGNINILKGSINGNEKLSEQIKNSEYVIYLYMHHHIMRYLDMSQFDFNYFYKDLFELNKIEKYLSKIFLFRYLILKIKINKMINEFPKSGNSALYVNKIVKVSAEEMKKYAPNAKYIVIIYDEKYSSIDGQNEHFKYYSEISDSPLWKELEKDGITVIHTRDLTGFDFDKNYKLKQDIAGWHPNARVWKEFTPVFAEKYIK